MCIFEPGERLKTLSYPFVAMALSSWRIAYSRLHREVSDSLRTCAKRVLLVPTVFTSRCQTCSLGCKSSSRLSPAIVVRCVKFRFLVALIFKFILPWVARQRLTIVGANGYSGNDIAFFPKIRPHFVLTWRWRQQNPSLMNWCSQGQNCIKN